MDAMSTLQLSQLRERAAQLLRKYRIPLLVFLLGVALALAQQHFGFLKLSGETFLIDAYPVEVHPSDLAWVIVTFVSVSYLISVLTVRAMIPKKEISQNRP